MWECGKSEQVTATLEIHPPEGKVCEPEKTRQGFKNEKRLKLHPSGNCLREKKKRVSTEWAMIAQFGGKITREGWVCSYMWWNIPEQGPKDLEGKGARCGSVGESPASRFSRWLKDSVLNLCGPIQNRVRGPPFSVHSWCVTVCFTHSHSNTDWSFIPLWKYLETAAHLWRA